MGWKNLSCWLKGGIIGAIFTILLLLIIRIVGSTFVGSTSIFMFVFDVPSVFLIFLFETIIRGIGLGSLFMMSNSEALTNVGLVFLVIFYFVVGAVIGWIYGLIKNSRKSKKRKK